MTAAEQTAVAYADGVLHIEPAASKNWILGNTGSVEVAIQLPAGSRVEAKAAAAELRGVGRLGDVTFDSAQGPRQDRRSRKRPPYSPRRRHLHRPPGRPRTDQHAKGGFVDVS